MRRFFDHIISHRQMWNTWKYCFQEVQASKRNRAKTVAKNGEYVKSIAVAVVDKSVSSRENPYKFET